MKNFDLNGFGVQEMDAKGMEEANGGRSIGKTIGGLLLDILLDYAWDYNAKHGTWPPHCNR